LDDEPANAARSHKILKAGKLGRQAPLEPNEQQELHTKGRLVVEDVTGPALAAGQGGRWCWVNGSSVGSVAGPREVARAGHSVALLIQREDAQLYFVDIG
jgi:hypothetical protein